MKNKAKWTALLMCGLLLLSGCSSVDDKDSTDKEDVITQATDAPEETPVPDTDVADPTVPPADAIDSPAPTVAPTEAPADAAETPIPTETPTIFVEQSTIPRITILPVEKIWYAEDSTTLLTVTDFTLSLDGDAFSTLQAAFDNHHPGILDEVYQYLYEGALDHYEFNLNPGHFNGYSVIFRAERSRCDSSVVSLRIIYGDYTGGAHGMYAYFGETYDVETGQQLLLADIVADAEGFYPNAIEYINNALYEEYEDGLFADYQSSVEQALSPDNEPFWYMTATGIVICFTPYEVGPYAMGAPEILLPYSEFATYLHEKYTLTTGELVAKVEPNQDFSSLIGSEEPIMIEAVDNDWQVDISLVSGPQKITFGTFNHCTGAYIIKRADSRCFVMITCDYMSDDYVTYLYEVTNGNLIECTKMPNMFPTGRTISAQNVEMSVAINALGSYGGYTNYTFTQEGQLIHDDELYQIKSPYVLNIIKPLPVTMDGTKTTLDAGTQISITGTNLVDEIYFKVVNTETTGTIHYTHEEPDTWIYLIDGVSEYEYFEDLPYAG